MSFSSSRVSGIVWRHLYLLPRSFDRITDTFFWPVIDVVAWGIMAQWLAGKSPQAQALLLAVLVSFVMWRIVWFSNYEIGVNLIEEAWNRNFTNMLSTPITKLEWLVGNILVGLLKLLVVVLVMALTIWGMYSANIFNVGWILIPFVAILILFGWSIGLLAAAAIMVIGLRAQALSWTLAVVFLPICAAYAPLAYLPEWVQLISALFPATYVFEAMRALVMHGYADWSMLLQGGVLAVCYLLLGLILLNITFERARKSGFSHLE